MIKDLNGLASEIAHREAKKSQASIGNIREIIKVLREIVQEQPDVLNLLKPVKVNPTELEPT